MMAPLLSGKKLCFVSVLRAGGGLLDGLLDLVPSARVGHIGLYRDAISKRPVEYFTKLPEEMEDRLVIVVDPMLATGNSAVAAVELLLIGSGSQPQAEPDGPDQQGGHHRQAHRDPAAAVRRRQAEAVAAVPDQVTYTGIEMIDQ